VAFDPRRSNLMHRGEKLRPGRGPVMVVGVQHSRNAEGPSGGGHPHTTLKFLAYTSHADLIANEVSADHPDAPIDRNAV